VLLLLQYACWKINKKKVMKEKSNSLSACQRITALVRSDKTEIHEAWVWVLFLQDTLGGSRLQVLGRTKCVPEPNGRNF
ncbi:MAG: hypothetical protein IKU21_02315, partial [Anaerotignum sp.]|nr:hypothetical protein [Anaerotignum sp.]